jgi:hypothetical protein
MGAVSMRPAPRIIDHLKKQRGTMGAIMDGLTRRDPRSGVERGAAARGDAAARGGHATTTAWPTWLGAKLVGARRSYELSNLAPSTSRPS